jgi:hypothetical protein
MRLDPRQYNSSWDVQTFVERDSETQIYFKPPPEPEPVPAPPALMPNVRTFEVADRFQMPVIAQRPSPFRVERTQHARRVPRSMVGLGFAVVCVLVGIAMGGAIAVGTSSWRANAAPAVAATPVKMTLTPPAPIEKPAPPRVTDPTGSGQRPEPIVTPIEALPPPQPTLPTPPVAVEPPPAPVAPPVAEPEPAPAPAPAPAPRHHRATAAAPKHAAGAGTLAVSSKPPCAIVIDGKATDLTSPQRSIALSAGTHSITLVNAEEGIHLTAEVVITADKTTQLIQDFTK